MPKTESAFSLFRKVAGYLMTQPILILFGAIAAIGGVFNVLMITVNNGVRAILLFSGYQLVGVSFLQHIVAIAIGILLSFFVILMFSGFSGGVIFKIASGYFHEEEDLWYGTLRRGIGSAVPLAIIWFLFYLAAFILILGIYRLGLLTLSAVVSPIASVVISILTFAVIGFVLLLLAAIAFNASCFVSIFRLKTWKAMAGGFDLFAQMPLLSVGFMCLICLVWLLGCFIMVAIYAILVFVLAWIAHFVISPDNLAGFLSHGLDDGLLIVPLLGILFVTNATLTAFGDIAWALFFLEHVSTVQLPKKSAAHGILQRALSEAETA